MKKPLVPFSIYLPEKMLQKLKDFAEAQEKSVNQVIIETLDYALSTT